MARVNLVRTVEHISWDDGPDAKRYPISFDDRGVERMLAECELLQRDLEGLGDDADPAHRAEAIRRFVVATVGQECYEDALAYADVEGVGAEGCVGVMGVFAQGIAQVILDHVGAAKAERVSRYLGGADFSVV